MSVKHARIGRLRELGYRLTQPVLVMRSRGLPTQPQPGLNPLLFVISPPRTVAVGVSGRRQTSERRASVRQLSDERASEVPALSTPRSPLAESINVKGGQC